MNGLKLLSIIVFLSVNSLCFSQWKDCSKQELSDVIRSIDQKAAKSKSFAYTAKQFFFNDSNSVDTVYKTDFSMSFKSKKELLNIEQMGVVLVQDSLVQVRCDSISKQIFVQNIDSNLINTGIARGFDAFMKSNTTVSKMIKGTTTIYKLKFAENTKYAYLELWVNSKDLVVSKYILYAGKEVYDDSQETDIWLKPRMEVVIDKYLFSEKVNEVKSKNISDFFADKSFLTPTSKYANYEVIDLRKSK